MVLTLGIAYWTVSILAAVFLLVCVVMMLTVLIQRPQGGGLSGAFGSGGGAGQTAFGTKTGDALTIATIAMFIVFLALAVGLNFATRPENIGAAQPQLVSGEGEAETEVTEEGDVADEAAAEDAAIDEAIENAGDQTNQDDATDLITGEVSPETVPADDAAAPEGDEPATTTPDDNG